MTKRYTITWDQEEETIRIQQVGPEQLEEIVAPDWWVSGALTEYHNVVKKKEG